MQTTLMKVLGILLKHMMWSVEKGAATSIYMATSEDVEGVTGKFYGNLKIKNIKPKYISKEGEQVIWDYCKKSCASYLRDIDSM